MAAILWFICMAIVLAIVYQMWLFDRLVQWEYEHYREHWERDGKPSGFYWRPKESAFWLSNSAMHRLAAVFVFNTPDWAAATPECRRWILQIRVMIFVTGLCALLFVAILLR